MTPICYLLEGTYRLKRSKFHHLPRFIYQQTVRKDWTLNTDPPTLEHKYVQCHVIRLRIDWFRIDDSIYCTQWHSTWLYFTVHYYIHTCVQRHVFTSRYSVAASNGGRPLSSGFPNCPQPQLPASHSNSSQRPNPSSSLTNCNTSKSKSKSNQSYVTTEGQAVSLSWCEAPFWAQDKISVTVRQLRVCWCWPPFLKTGRVCRL
jgi:hypothetical protein